VVKVRFGALGALVMLVVGLLTWAAVRPDQPVQSWPPAPPSAFVVHVPEPLRVAVIGDSFTGGSPEGGTDFRTNWTGYLVPTMRDAGVTAEVFRHGASGAGFVNPGKDGKTFAQIVPSMLDGKTDVLILYGGINDAWMPGADKGALAAITEARLLSPRIQIVIIGPVHPPGIPDSIAATHDELLRATKQAGVPFIDPLSERWLQGDEAQYVGKDKVHPTNSGHAILGKRIAQRLLDLHLDPKIGISAPS
jgi:lysophospholipase L1-like esterase